MKQHKDLLAILRANHMRITAGRRLLLQFILDNRARGVRLGEIQSHLEAKMGQVDRTSVYRNLIALQGLGIIQALKLANQGKTFQYVLDRKIHGSYICKACGNARRGDRKLFGRIEAALHGVRGFSRANLSIVLYGTCADCAKRARAARRRAVRANR